MILVITSKHNCSDKRIYKNEICSFLSFNLSVDYLFFNGDKSELNQHKGYERNLGIFDYGRLGYFFTKYLTILRFIFKRKYKFIHLHDPDLLLLVPILKLIKKKVIYDCHEIYFYTILNKHYIKSKIISRLISRFFLFYEKICFSWVDQVIFVSDHQKIFYNKLDALVVTNYPLINLNYADPPFRKRLIFAGNISRNYLIEIILGAIENTDIKLSLFGKCYDMEYLHYLKNLEGWKNVDYYGLCKFEDIANEYRLGGVGVFLHKYTGNVGFKAGSDGVIKIYEYFSFGLPVVMTDFNNLRLINDRFKVGCLCDNDIDSFTFAIDEIFKERNYWNLSIGARRAHLERLNWSFVVKSLRVDYLPMRIK
jgi:glycosyltransferase involved in cell wall biosynthesis